MFFLCTFIQVAFKFIYDKGNQLEDKYGGEKDLEYILKAFGMVFDLFAFYLEQCVSMIQKVI